MISAKEKKYCPNNRENNWGKIKKESQCFIYNHLSPDYKSTKKSVWNIKAHGIISSVFSVLGIHTITDKTLCNNYCIMRGLKAELNLVLMV